MMCGRRASAIDWAIMSMPPTRTAVFRPMPAPKASNCSAIWMASSRVGERTRAYSSCGLSIRPCRTGSAKAPVLPEPVWARPIMSLPAPRSSAFQMRERAPGHRPPLRSTTILTCAHKCGRPLMRGGTACCCIGEGVFQPRLAAASASCVHRPSSSKALIAAARSSSVIVSVSLAPMLADC